MEQQLEKEKPIAVCDRMERHLSYCTKKRAAQMVFRQKAKWVGRNRLMIVVSRDEEKAMRKEVRMRDNCRCYICDEQLTPETVTYDHMTPRSRGGAESVDNLACCCRECNEDKADRTVMEYFLCLAARIMHYKMGYTM